MPKFTYVGPIAVIDTRLDGRVVSELKRGETVEVSDEQAKSLERDKVNWSKEAAKKSSPEKGAEKSTPPATKEGD